MAAKSVSHTVSLSVDTVSLSLSDTSTADADPTDFATGVQRVGTSAEYIGRADIGDKLGDVDLEACNVLLLLKNDNTSGGELKVALNNDDPASSPILFIKPQQINLLSVDNLKNVRVCSHLGNCDFTYMAIQIGSGDA